MTRIIEQVASALLILAAIVALFGLLRTYWPGTRDLCAGRRVPLWLWLWPPTWLVRRGCWYDLRHTAPGADGCKLCPECGRRSPARALLRRSARLRIAPMLGLLLVVAVPASQVRWLRRGGWARPMPSVVLLGVERVFGGLAPNAGRWQLADRLDRDRLSDWSKRQLAAAAVHELGNDWREWNAQWAIDVLYGLGATGVPPLKDALRSRDLQRRQLAAHLLREMASSDWRGPPQPWRVELRSSPDLLRVTVEGLRDDQLPYGGASGGWHTTWIFNAHDGVDFLVRTGRSPNAAGPLAAALKSDDAQQRLLAAVVIAWTGETSLNDEAIPVLLNHLRDNAMTGDAKAAVRALYAIGAPIVPYLNAAASTADRQQTELMQLLALNLVWPEAPRWMRTPLNTITVVALDPSTGPDMELSIRHLE